MLQENVEAVRAVYDRWSNGDFQATLDLFDPLALLIQRAGFPEAGTYLGMEEIVEYTRGFLEPWTRIGIEVEDMTDAGDSVVAAVRQRGVGAASGATTEFRYYQVWSFRGRKVIRLENFRERSDALEAVGLSEQAMSRENVEIVRRSFEAFNRDGPEASVAWLAPDLEWHDLPDLPDAEVYHGHAGFLRAFEQFFGELKDYSVNVDELIDHGEQVVVCARIVGGGRGSGAKFEQRIFGVWTVRNRLVARAVWFRSREEALETAGLTK